MYKLSRFNYYMELENDLVGIYNSNTSKLSLVTKALFDIDQETGLIDLGPNPLDPQTIMHLSSNGFIVHHSLNELDLLKVKYDSIFHQSINGFGGSDEFALTVFVTLECDFRCAYCFQELELRDGLKFPVMMSKQTYENLLSFIGTKTRTFKNFTLDLFGGEPFLFKDFTKKLITDAWRVCKNNSCKLQNISFITNGHNLDPDMVDFLKAVDGRKFAVVTLDGLADVHDKRRCLKNGGPTFDKIYANLLYILEKGGQDFSVKIRMNVDDGNKDEISKLIGRLKSDGFQDDKRFSVMHYFVGLANSKSFKDQSGTIIECLQPSVALEMDVSYREQFKLDSVFNILFDNARTYTLSASCNPNHVYVDPLGNLFRCHYDVGNADKICGSVNGDFFSITQTQVDYMRFRAWDKEHCRKCPALPKCVFFCPNALRGDKACTRYDQALRRQIHKQLVEASTTPGSRSGCPKPLLQTVFFTNRQD